MKESTSALQETTTLHQQVKLACANFLYNTNTSAFPKTTLHHEENVMHGIFPSIMKK